MASFVSAIRKTTRRHKLGLFGLCVATLILFWGIADATPIALRYSQLVSNIESSKISSIIIDPDRGTALATDIYGNEYSANLAPDKDLLKLLEDHNVEISVQRAKNTSPSQQAIGSLIYPAVMLVILSPIVLLGLFIYSAPSLIAFRRKHGYKWIILILNIFGGLGGVTWVIAFIWALWPDNTSLTDFTSNPTGRKR